MCETPDCVAHIKCTGLISGHLCGDCNGLKEGDRHHLNSWSSGSSAIWRIISYSYNCSACRSLLLHNLPIYRSFDFFPWCSSDFLLKFIFFSTCGSRRSAKTRPVTVLSCSDSLRVSMLNLCGCRVGGKILIFCHWLQCFRDHHFFTYSVGSCESFPSFWEFVFIFLGI